MLEGVDGEIHPGIIERETLFVRRDAGRIGDVDLEVRHLMIFGIGTAANKVGSSQILIRKPRPSKRRFT